MKFEIKREPTKAIDVISVEIIDTNPPSVWTHWKALGASAVAGSLLTLGILFWLNAGDLTRFGITVQTNRSTTVMLRSNDEQERHRAGANGTSTPSH